MANLKVNNYYSFKLIPNEDEYWDFYLNKDSFGAYKIPSCAFSDDCLLSYIDMGDSACISQDGKWLYSKKEYTWEDAVSIGYTLYNITYTGVDNGLFLFQRDRITNKEFVEFFKKNKYHIEQDDKRIVLHAVSGNTQQYDYPMTTHDDYIEFNGGFYQGFLKTECGKYQVLPLSYNDGETYNFEFTLMRKNLLKVSDKTLNDKYPDNKGIFFYIGTRAENKWIYLYDKDDKDDLEKCFQLGMDDFVEDGEIDKSSYIIGNFFDLDVEFSEDPVIDIDNYTNFNYYDDALYAIDSCDWNEMYDYLEITPVQSAKTIDEEEKHEKMVSWCCNDAEPSHPTYELLPFYTGCACQKQYKLQRVENNEDMDDTIHGCDVFGEDDYIDGWDGLSNLEDCTSYVEPELDISDFEYYTDNGFNLAEANWYYFYTDNKFMMFDRTRNGMTVENWIDGTEFMYYGRNNNFKGNLFLLMNRTKTGYTVDNIDELRNQYANEYDPYKDIYNNALAFRITDDGCIGYRLLTIDCDIAGRNKTSMIEGYSSIGVIPLDEWVVINVRISFLGVNKMKIYFYVNGKLKYITKELPRINLRKLNDLYEKQEGVPYNMSIGGGSQGLAETIQYNYMLNPTRVYPIERYFAGSFIGYIKTFKIYNCFMEQLQINNNFCNEMDKLSLITIYK